MPEYKDFHIKCPHCGSDRYIWEAHRYSDSLWCGACGKKLSHDTWIYVDDQPAVTEDKEEQQFIRDQYTLPEPVSKPPQPSYTPPVFSSNDSNEWDEEDEDEYSEEWDEEDEEDDVVEKGGRRDVPVPVLRPFSTLPIDSASRLQGLYIIGATGTGKSTLLEHLIIKDIEQGLGVCLIEPHGDITQNVLSRIPAEREQDIIYLNLMYTPAPFGLNLFECANPKDIEEVEHTRSFVTHVFEKVLGADVQKTPDLLMVLNHVTYTLIGNQGMTFLEVPFLLQNKQVRNKLVANVTNPQTRQFWRGFEQRSDREQRELIRSTVNRVNDFAGNLILQNIVGQSKTTLDFRKIMDEGKILLIQLSPRLDDISNLVGAVIIGKLLNAAYARPQGQRRQFHIYADEFQRFAVADFASFFAEARKFGIGLTVAHQWRGQLDNANQGATKTVANLVVFHVQPEDAEELAGLFTITPQEAWEEELEEERVEVVRPQRHERVEEQVEVEVEDDILEVTQDPVDYLVTARGTHTSIRVREITQNLLTDLQTRNTTKMLINNLLVAVMDKRVQIKTEVFVDRMDRITRAYTNLRWPYGTVPFAENKQFIRILILPPDNQEEIIRQIIENLLIEYIHRYKEIWLKEYHPNRTWEEEERSWSIRRKKDLMQGAEIVGSFVTQITTLAEELAQEPIRVPTGKKRMVKRIQPHITYLTHESEKITHPRKTILHPQRTYADMLNEVASQLVHLPDYQARVKIGTQEYGVTTDPPQIGLTGPSLQERIDTVWDNNLRDGYTRRKQEVEQEIAKRQAALLATKEDEPPQRRSSKE